MSIWAYKVITSGKGGFATPALLESFLNQLGSDGWEIIHFQTQLDNPLAFTGLARRTTQRDWTLEDAAAAAARAEGDKIRAEFEAKFKDARVPAAGEEKPESLQAEKAGADDGLRRLRDTDSDRDPDAPEENAEPDEWESLAKEDELPTFFEAIQPLMRRNQRGAGLSAGVDHLARKWGMTEEDVVGALKECGFVIPEDENTRPAYVEYDGDLYWVNVNRRGELWINTKEKMRQPFRVVTATPVKPAEKESGGEQPAEAPQPRAESPAEAAPATTVPLQAGPELLDRIRPHMRRNRRGPGGSGSISFLSRALKCGEADLMAGFAGIGLVLSDLPDAKPVVVPFGDEEWWLNKDQRGGVWINGQERQVDKSAADSAPQAETPAGEPAPAPHPEAPRSDSVFTAVRLLLKPTKTGGLAARTDWLAETLGKTPEALIEALTGLGLKVPEKPREKPVFVEDAGEIFWLNRNAKDELWLNAKASKFAEGGESSKKKSRRGPA